MPDRSRPSSPPQDPDAQGRESRDAGARGSGSQGTGKDDDNPFAPPPEGTPDRPWQPRRPSGNAGPDGEGSGSGSGSGDSHGSPWGSQWSDRQPGRSQGGFGDRPRQQNGPGKEDPSSPGGSGMRWDPADPAQRRARYALLSGMWGFFFALFGWRYLALLLGALAVMWAVQALRAKPRTRDAADAAARAAVSAPTPTATAATPPAPADRAPADRAPADPPSSTRPQTTAAISGLVTGGLALLMVAATFTAQLVYRDYYTCVDDALTNASQQSCEDHLPKPLRPLLGEQD
ncbi:hypothetical protein AB0C93_07015 [Streptomyces sp. NPDC048518]|uniref:hypothetical protein n=1 Tax=Streptomyces sp. NPDC048518 TaxID=3155029 RepID=UPI0033D4A806